jgi:broad specificity phosphatase PhoE
MAQLLLIRHAQASFGSDNYDQLSQLGYQQAKWLGEHFSDKELHPDKLIGGTLLRHKQTANEIIKSSHKPLEFQQDDCWNEFEFKEIITAYLEQHPNEQPQTKDSKQFFSILKRSMKAWSQDELRYHHGESWLSFEERVSSALSDLHKQAGKDEVVWLVTSGGVISMLMKQVLAVNNEIAIDLNFQIRNTSITDIVLTKAGKALSGFNHVPHLESIKRRHNITFA